MTARQASRFIVAAGASGLLGVVSSCAPALPAPLESTATAGSASAPPNAAPRVRSPFVWPAGKRAAVSLTYDDALESQLQNAAPALRRHAIHGTFFLTGDTARASAGRWSAVRAEGNELASHTMVHPCEASQSWVPKGNALEDYDAGRMQRELEASIALLKSLGVARPPYTFAYPCGVTWLGPNHESYAPLTERFFLAARGVQAHVADPNTVLLSEVPSVSGSASAEELIRQVESNEQLGGWLVFMFHGVGGDYMTVTSEAHEALLAYLEQHREAIWTDSFLQVAGYVTSHRAPP